MAHKLLEDCIDAVLPPNAKLRDLAEVKGALTENQPYSKRDLFYWVGATLLKRLSRTRQATAAGFAFMAAACLSQKSALNMKGLCHTDNVTEFRVPAI